MSDAVTYRCELPVLGIPVRFETNAPDVLEVIEETFGLWRSLQRFPNLIAADGAVARFTVRSGDEGPRRHAPLSYHIPRFERVEVTTPGSRGSADATRREIIADVTPALVADRAHFRYGVVEALTLALLTRYDRTPLHAAAIVRDGTALLLAGPSGVGKSTLCYVALRDAGYKVLTDDAVYLQLTPELRVWGIPRYLHLPPEAAKRFSELAGLESRLLANGKEKVAFDVRAAGGLVMPPMVTRACVCLLTRGTTRAAVSQLSGSMVVERLSTKLDEGFDTFAGFVPRAMGLLVRNRGWALQSGSEPEDSIPLIDGIFESLAQEDFNGER